MKRLVTAREQAEMLLPWRTTTDEPTTLHRGVGFRRGDLPPELEQRVDSALSGDSGDHGLHADLMSHLTQDGSAGNFWALNPTVADLSGRQVNFRHPADVQVSMSGNWDGSGRDSDESVDPRYRKLVPGAPVDVHTLKIRRPPSGSWMNSNDEGWVDLPRQSGQVHP